MFCFSLIQSISWCIWSMALCYMWRGKKSSEHTEPSINLCFPVPETNEFFSSFTFFLLLIHSLRKKMFISFLKPESWATWHGSLICRDKNLLEKAGAAELMPGCKEAIWSGRLFIWASLTSLHGHSPDELCSFSENNPSKWLWNEMTYYCIGL